MAKKPGRAPHPSVKARMFVEALLADPEMNATRAYESVYVARGHAAAVGAAKLRARPEVAALIDAAIAARAKRVQISADRVLEEIARVAFSDMRRFATWGPDGVSLVASETLDEDAARCVAEVSESTTQGGGSLRFKLHDKGNALTLLCRHLGILNDKVEHSGTVQHAVVMLPELGEGES